MTTISSSDISKTALGLASTPSGLAWSMIVIMGLLAGYAMYLMNVGRQEIQAVVKENNTVIREIIQIMGRIDGKLNNLTVE